MTKPARDLLRWTAARNHVASDLLAYRRARKAHLRGIGRPPRIMRARTFNEKLARKKVLDRRPLLALTADKVAVRSYVAALAGDDVLPLVYAVVDSPDDLDFDKLPESFVLKASHGSGMTYPVPERALVSPDALRQAASSWLRAEHGPSLGERWYGDVQPRLIVEEYLGDPHLGPPSDYKFFVFDGRTEMVQVDIDRFDDHRRNLYLPDWTRIPCGLLYPQADVDLPAPDNLERMLRMAAQLSSGTDFVRVDLYDLGDRVVFGELTHCPGSGAEPFSDPAVDAWLGSCWKQPLRYR